MSPSPEVKLLMWCLRREGQAGDLADVCEGILADQPTWKILCRAALHHGVLPLLYARLSQCKTAAFAGDGIEELKAAYVGVSLWNQRMTAELVGILELLDDHDIEALAFKGPALAQVAYGDITMRQFSDLDLLVRQRDLRRVRGLLVSRGYRQRHSMTPLQESIHLRCDFESEFFHPTTGIAVDVHWRFRADYPGSSRDPALAFERKVFVELLGHRVPALGPEDHAIYLCMHGCLNLWRRLSYLADLDALLGSRPTWDWEHLLQMAKGSGLSRSLLLGLTLANDVCGTDLPVRICEAADAERSVTSLRQRIQDAPGWARVADAARDGAPDYLEILRFQWALRENLTEKLAYCLRHLFMPTVYDWDEFRVPDPLYPVYFVLRPVRLIRTLRRNRVATESSPRSSAHST